MKSYSEYLVFNTIHRAEIQNITPTLDQALRMKRVIVKIIGD